MKKSAALVLAVASLVATGCQRGTDQTSLLDNRRPVHVASVVDGDTLRIRIAEREERVRLIGVDAPESVQPGGAIECYGEAAAVFTRRSLGGQSIRLEFDIQRRDRFGRVLAYVYLRGTLFNRTLVAGGYAVEQAYPPNTKYQRDLLLAEAEARRLRRGLWKACTR